MTVLRPIVVPTVGQPVPVRLTQPRSRGRGMADPRFYENQPPDVGYNSLQPQVQQFDQEPITESLFAERMKQVKERTPPPALKPSARVREADPNAIDRNLFESFYNRLATINDVGQSALAAEQARNAARRLSALNQVGSMTPGPGGTPSTGSGSGGYTNTPVAGRGGSAQVQAWIGQAAKILQQKMGLRISPDEARWLGVLIMKESGGNPNAQNNWDINAKRGTPSIGLMQTIGPTFSGNMLPGYGNIRDPIHNIMAGIRYGIRRYGSIYNIPGIRSMRSGGPYRPY